MLNLKSLLLSCLAVGCPAAQAGSTLSYAVTENGQKAIQTLNVQDGLVWITGLGGNTRLDVLIDPTGAQLALIDHQHQRYRPINEDRLRKLARQIEDVAPLVKGLGQQIRQLNPEQQGKWEKMLGGFPLEAFDTARKELGKTSLKQAGAARTVAGIRCVPQRLTAGTQTELELCMTQPESLHLSAPDTETLKSTIQLFRRQAESIHALAKRFGLGLSQAVVSDLIGIPLQVKELKGKRPLSISLDHAEQVKAPLKPLEIPAGYQMEKLKLW